MAIILKFLKFFNSLLFSEVKVLVVSSDKVSIFLSENNSLNLSNTEVLTLEMFFIIKDLSLKIAFKIKPGLKSIFKSINLFSSLSLANNFSLIFLTNSIFKSE